MQRSAAALTICLAAILAGCSAAAEGEGSTLTIYSSVTEDTVEAVVEQFEADNPDATVEVFRAPTGELTARIASDLRSDGIQADVLWLTDPLSIQQYAADGHLLAWTPEAAAEVPADYVTDSFIGTRILNLVMVQGEGVSVADWEDLVEVEGEVAFPDPGFAGSAFGALAHFSAADGYGMDFYRRLADGPGVQVQSPGDVVSGVAEGRYAAGITLSRSARAAMDDGSPIQEVWPSSGAIAIYSPIAVVESTSSEDLARSFVEHTLGPTAQQAIAETGWQPVREDVDWETGGPQVSVDWASAFDRQEELLSDYRDIFGG